MTESEKPAKKPLPKGGRKGGTTFPRISLKQALEYAHKLVGKTHTGPQPAKTILPGVFGNAGSEGEVRASALKQFGLLEGPKSAYQATKLAKDIVAAPAEDQRPLLQRAFLNSKLFKDIFDTFHGDSVTKAKIRQRALALKVHPDSADDCVDCFTDSAAGAGLGALNGDSISLVAASVAAVTAGDSAEDEGATAPSEELETTAAGAAADSKSNPPSGAQTRAAGENKSGVIVNLNVDSSSDPDKLEKQLKLLREYGVI